MNIYSFSYILLLYECISNLRTHPARAVLTPSVLHPVSILILERYVPIPNYVVTDCDRENCGTILPPLILLLLLL